LQQGEAESGRTLRADKVDGGGKTARFLPQAVPGIGIGGVDRPRSAGVEGGLALLRVYVRYGRAHAVDGARQVDSGKPEPAGPDDQQRVIHVNRRRLFQRAIGREARTREGGGEGLRQRVELDEIPRMVEENVIAETPVTVNAEVVRPHAKILLAGSAQRALPIDNPAIANMSAGRIWPQLVDHADDLVAENAGWLHRLRQVGLFARGPGQNILRTDGCRSDRRRTREHEAAPECPSEPAETR
jgi:hypothetical protein